MSIKVNLRGEGDMKKSTYDPNKDGVIAKAQIDVDFSPSGYTTIDGEVLSTDGVTTKDTGDVVLDSVATERESPNDTTIGWFNSYTILKGDLTDKLKKGKYTLTAEGKRITAGSYYLYYRKNGGAEVQIGTGFDDAYTSKNIADQVLEIGDIIEFGVKNDTNTRTAKMQNTEIKHTHILYKVVYYNY